MEKPKKVRGKAIESVHPKNSKEWWRDYRKAHQDKLRAYKREYDRQMYKKYPERENNRRKRWNEANPEKHKAQIKLNSALESGKVVRHPCEVCGSVPVHAHHTDYSKPLEVRWLCPIHHSEVTRGVRIL